MRVRALYWWIDRWRRSTAYNDMTLEEQGAYRNLLDEAALRGGALPLDERAIAKASGDATRWKKVKKTVMKRFTKTRDGWHNETLDKVLQETNLRAERQRRWRNGRHNGGHNEGHSPDQDQDQDPEIRSVRVLERVVQARSHAPILVAVTHETLKAGTFESIADVAETVKRQAATLRIPYDGDTVAKAIRSVGARRSLMKGVR
jgi:uncharacterized protein YdaU (DUF1376 family)